MDSNARKTAADKPATGTIVDDRLHEAIDPGHAPRRAEVLEITR